MHQSPRRTEPGNDQLEVNRRPMLNSQFHKHHGNLGSWTRIEQKLEVAESSWTPPYRYPKASRAQHREERWLGMTERRMEKERA